MRSFYHWAYPPDPYAFANFFPLNHCEPKPFSDQKSKFSSKEIELFSELDSFISVIDNEPRKNATQNVVELFRSVARAYPSTVAVDAGPFHITYAELDELSTQLASYIRLRAVPGQPIPFLTELSTSAVVGILGILKAGSIYVPIDCSQWPEEHIINVLKAIGGEVLVYSDQFGQIAKKFPQYSTAISVGEQGRISFKDAFMEEEGCFSVVHPSLCTGHGEQELACLIFTSGTTGKPKGVMIRHEALINFVISRKPYLSPDKGSRSLLTLSVSFDACNGYLFSFICHGATVVLANPNTLQDRFSTCSIVVLTPSMLKSLVPPSVGLDNDLHQMSYPQLQTIILGGETASQGLLSAWHPLGVPWIAYNDYGPTEATCGVLTGPFLWNDSSERFENSLLGLPIPGVVVKLRGADGEEISAEGGEGEIMIGGVCLAEGYWRDPDRTAEGFVMWNSGRYFRTGDRGRWSAVGDLMRIDFLGRTDRIVKNRGFLVNLETEVDASVLGSNSASTWKVSDAFTVMVDGVMCMLASPSHVDVHGLKVWMAERFPAYQVPDRFLTTDQLPRGRTGKIDPKAVQATFKQPEIDAIPDERSSLEDWTAELRSSISVILGLPRLVLPAEKFLDLGGHSLAAVAVAGRCRRLGATIDTRQVLFSQTIGDLIEVCRQARQYRQPEIFELPTSTLHPRVGNMTKTQLALIHASNESPGSSIIQTTFLFPTHTIPALRQAWKRALETEPIFQTTFDIVKGLQIVEEDKVEFLWSEIIVASQEAYESESQNVSIAIGVGTTFKVVSFQEQCRLIWTVHHALIDGVSVSLLLQKVDAILHGIPVQQGRSFLWLVGNIQLRGNSLSAAAKEFWRQQRLEVPNAIGKVDLLPKPNSPVTITADGSINADTEGIIEIPSDEIFELARRFGVTPVTLFHAAWAILLLNYTGSTEVTFGIVMSGRDVMALGVEDTIGPLVCTASLRILIDLSVPVADLARYIFTKLQSLSLYQWLPDEEASFFFDTAVVSHQNLPNQPFTIERIHETSTIPIILVIQDEGRFRLNYRKDMYTNVNMLRVVESLRHIFHAMVVPDIDVATCAQHMISAKSQLELLQYSNAFSSDSHVENAKDTVLDIFERTVRDYPHLHAVRKGGNSITFADLDLASTKLAKRIAEYTSVGDVVGLHADRSINWLIGIFGIIKAGTTYCPLDESLPGEVRVDMFTRAGATLFLAPTSQGLAFAPTSAPTSLVIQKTLIEEDGPPLRQCPRNPRAILYICFTSGSTGKPKGVLVEHGGLVEFQKHLPSRMYAKPGRSMMQFLSVGFDGSMIEIFSALCYGTTLVLRPEDDNAFAAFTDVDIAVITPSAAEGLNPSDFPNLKYLYFAGEPLTQQMVEAWAPGRFLFNYYGPTEATIGAILKPCAPGTPVTIGRPIPTMRAYILNYRRQLVLPGVVGEIVLAGVQVARGYLGMPAETATKFLPDTVSGRLDERMYLTGDLGYWTEEGEILCLGRKDRQAKVRGFRINLGNVEEAICAHDEVQTAAVNVFQDSLIAWVTPACVDIEDVFRKLSESVPVHARPQRIIAVDSFPLTRNGKLDYKLLLNDVSRPLPRQSCPEVLNDTEILIAKEWRSLLNLDDTQDILLFNTFIGLGGHSMRQLALASRLSNKFGIRIPMRLVIKCETLKDLACAVDQLREGVERQAMTGRRELGQIELSPVEEEWWLKYQVACSSAAATFNVPFACSLSVHVDYSLLASIWSAVISRHKILSSRFAQDCKGRPYRELSPTPPKAHVVADIDVGKTIAEPFNLSTDDLVRVRITPSKLVVVISHILCDLTALRALVNEVSIAYKDSVPPSSHPWPKCLAYMKLSSWFEQPCPSDLSFWSEYLKDLPQYTKTATPTDFSGSSEVFRIAPALLQDILNFHSRHSATLYQTILLATAICLQSLTGTYDIALGTPFMNRTQASEMNIVGLFLQALPFRLNLSDVKTDAGVRNDVSIASLMDHTKSSFREMLSHAIPWQQLLAHLGLDFQRHGLMHPIFDTVVTLNDHRESPPISLDIDGAGPSQYLYTTGAKFKLLFEYTIFSDCELQLRIEYSTQKLELKTIMAVYAGLLACFKGMCRGSPLLVIRDSISGASDGLEYGA